LGVFRRAGKVKINSGAFVLDEPPEMALIEKVTAPRSVTG
jgi:hypothetical protein